MTTTSESAPRSTLGDLLRRARLDAGLEQAELAEKVGVSRAAIGAWERDRSAPDFPWVKRIVAVTGATWLFEEPYRDDIKTQSRYLGDFADQPLLAMAG